jgi:hypothetical protein
MRRIFIKKCFLFTVGSVSRVKRFRTRSSNSLKGEEVATELLKGLRQESKDFYAVCFDALVMRWDRCINVVFPPAI